jgi:hypothetical protein
LLGTRACGHPERNERRHEVHRALFVRSLASLAMTHIAEPHLFYFIVFPSVILSEVEESLIVRRRDVSTRSTSLRARLSLDMTTVFIASH